MKFIRYNRKSLLQNVSQQNRLNETIGNLRLLVGGFKLIKKKIILIGGGELGDHETIEIDRRIVSISEKDNPRLLFIPTASFDAEGYIEVVNRIFGDELGCKVTTLKLIDESVTREEAKEMILTSDIIYVGGGSTKNLMYHINRLSLAPFFKKAWEQGVVLSGISAGSICWFDYGHSDSVAYETGNQSPYILIKGLGIISGLHCPHYNDNRQEDFKDMVRRENMIGIALEDFTALEIIDGNFKVIKTRNDAKVYKIYEANGQIVEEEIKVKNEYMSYVDMMNKKAQLRNQT